MTAEVVPFEQRTNDELIGALISSHGDIALAAERLKVNEYTLLAKLPELSYEKLLAAVKTARMLQAFDLWTIARHTTETSFSDLTASQMSKFLIDFMDRFEVMVNPPVHGGSGQAPMLQQFNFGDADAERARLVNAMAAAKALPNVIDGEVADGS